jgi:hypothetical protein
MVPREVWRERQKARPQSQGWLSRATLLLPGFAPAGFADFAAASTFNKGLLALQPVILICAAG